MFRQRFRRCRPKLQIIGWDLPLVGGAENPLTARVTVNRMWQLHFGTGLVKTVEDFGSQGETPSHPELLDWLATELIRTGWDIKAMHKRIMISTTYRQASKVTPEMAQRSRQSFARARPTPSTIGRNAAR